MRVSWYKDCFLSFGKHPSGRQFLENQIGMDVSLYSCYTEKMEFITVGAASWVFDVNIRSGATIEWSSPDNFPWKKRENGERLGRMVSEKIVVWCKIYHSPNGCLKIWKIYQVWKRVLGVLGEMSSFISLNCEVKSNNPYRKNEPRPFFSY